MGRGWNRIPTVGGNWFIAFFGGVYLALGIQHTFLDATSGESLLSDLTDFTIIAVPSLTLLYGGYQLPKSEIDPDTYPRIVAWCLAGFGLILCVLVLLHLEPGITFRYPSWSTTFSTAVGTVGGFLIGVYDARAITQARQLQQQREQLKHQQQELQRQSRELQHQNERLESFASLLAHELRNPLSIAQIYQQQAANGDHRAAEEVEAALARIKEMVEVILVIARGEDTEIDRQVVTLANIAEDACADIDVPKAELIVETDHTLLANPIHLRHLLENLFTNAVEHANESVTIRVGSLPSGFYVEDDGPGIPEADRDQIFEAGYTTDGTGFGLMFVAELAEVYGWNYAITEGADGGARFEFTDVDLAGVQERQQH